MSYLSIRQEVQEANRDLANKGVKNKILFFGDSKTRGCGATVMLASGEPCLLSIAQSGIFVKKSRHGLFGATLYNEKNVYTNAQRTGALAYLFPDKLFPNGVTNPNLRAFFNAILHCQSAVEVSVTLNEAVQIAERKAGCTLQELSEQDFPSWSLRVDFINADPKPEASDSFTPAEMASVLEKYQALIEKYPISYMDETWLPLPKDQMRVVFKRVWKIAPTAEMRNYVEVAWIKLSMFQKGIGPTPVNGGVRGHSPESMRIIDRYLQLSNASKPESDRDFREMREFTRANSINQ